MFNICISTHAIICIYMFVLDLSQIMKVTGTCVVRGRDWKWGDQDGTGAGGAVQIGTITSGLGSSDTADGWVNVLWANGARSKCRMGANWAYDLELSGA